MLSGATPRARAMPGTAVLRMVVSRDCMKKATPTRQGHGRALGGRYTARPSCVRRAAMCDNDSMDDMIQYQLKSAQLSRRRFGAFTLGAGVASLLPAGAHAAWIEEAEVDVKTPDGTADAYFVHPGEGKYPGVLMWPDIYGLRPAFRQMARRLAGGGYAVLVPNPFYRTKRAPTAPENPEFNDPATRNAMMSLAGSVTPAMVVADGTAYVEWLDAQPS